MREEEREGGGSQKETGNQTKITVTLRQMEARVTTPRLVCGVLLGAVCLSFSPHSLWCLALASFPGIL